MLSSASVCEATAGEAGTGRSRGQHMTKDDALRIALSALLDCTYDERMRAPAQATRYKSFSGFWRDSGAASISARTNAAPPLRLTLSIISCGITTRSVGLVPDPDKLFLGTPRQPPRLGLVVFMPLLYTFVFIAVLQTITD